MERVLRYFAHFLVVELSYLHNYYVSLTSLAANWPSNIENVTVAFFAFHPIFSLSFPTQRFSGHWILTNVFVTQADHFVID